MPVSKKRKKAGKPVQRRATAQTEEQHMHPEGHPLHEKQRGGKPTNPFVAQQSQHRGAQRGR